MNIGTGGICVFDLSGYHIRNNRVAEDSKTYFPGIYEFLTNAVKTGKSIWFQNIKIDTAYGLDASRPTYTSLQVNPFYQVDLSDSTLCVDIGLPGQTKRWYVYSDFLDESP